ncbi:MAG: hypothetical protein PHC88_05560 [Terrimicrobiaceae bacterium]|nr:hypothetical protein [Terrimicrobiaceae bacterium]
MPSNLFGGGPSLSDLMRGPSNKAAKGLLTPGNIINLYNRPQTQAPAGPDGMQPGAWSPGVYPRQSTTYSASFPAKELGFGEGQILIPLVVNGKFLTTSEAIDHARKTGQHLGIFDTWQNADAFAEALHESQQASGNRYGPTSRQ